ncbi:MAG: preprotein translocase subunit YajC [Pseudomonadota bacterium]
MNFLHDWIIPSAVAQSAAQPAANPMGSIIMFVVIIAIFWLLIIRPQMKRNKQHRELVGALAVGDEVVTAGGLLGRITEVGDSFLNVELADGVTVKLQKQSVAQVVPKGTIKSAS